MGWKFHGNPVLAVSDDKAGREALKILDGIGVKPDIRKVKSDVGEPVVELFSADGDFAGLTRIREYAESVKNHVDAR